MRHLISDFTIDFLLIDAGVRLAFERQRKGIRQPVASAGTILFLPLAAAGAAMPDETRFFSEDHNFSVRYSGHDPLCCELQALGHAAIGVVQNRELEVCYDGQFFFLAHFNDKGFARFVLPEQTADGRRWQSLRFVIRT